MIVVGLAACGKVEPLTTDGAVMPTLTVVLTGSGTVTSTPAGIDCGSMCSTQVPLGTQLTLAATPMADETFVGWSGGTCSGTDPCMVTVDADTTVTASFQCSSMATIDFTGAIVTFTIPSCANTLTIDAFGAQGGNASAVSGGLGAEIKGTFTVTGGEQLKVLVGGRGIDAGDVMEGGGGTGGGGTFVTSMSNTPLVVAGGGGGACFITTGGTGNSIGLGGTTGQNGLAGNDGNSGDGCATGPCMPGGTGGNGGTSSGWTGWQAGAGGGGLTGDGVNLTGGQASFGTPNGPGKAFVNGGAGGIAGTQMNARNGGFGGGGSAGASGGGGGGYSGGGGGGDYEYGGGGGGSFNGGTAPTNTAGTRSGNGMVVFSW